MLVMFNNRQIFQQPYYSLPFYDKQQGEKGKKRLLNKIMRGLHADKHDFAVIYELSTNKAVEYYKKGRLIEGNTQKFPRIYGKDISLLRLWLLLYSENATNARADSFCVASLIGFLNVCLLVTMIII